MYYTVHCVLQCLLCALCSALFSALCTVVHCVVHCVLLYALQALKAATEQNTMLRNRLARIHAESDMVELTPGGARVAIDHSHYIIFVIGIHKYTNAK